MKKGLWIVLILIAGFCVVFAYEATRISKEEPQSWIFDQNGDCAIVLTGGAGRIREGFDLLAQGAIKKLMIAGVNPQSNLREIFPMLPYYGSVRDQDVFLEKRSRTTFGNAQQSLALIEAFGCREVILVTSRLHMRRAFKTFRAVFPQDIKILPRSVVSGSYESSLDDLALETLKALFYSLWAY